MTRQDRRAVGARRRMLLGAADFVDRAVRNGQVDLVRGRARFLGSEPEISEQGLGHPMMTLVLLQGAGTPVREPTLAAEARDQPELFEGPQVGQGGGWSHPKPERDILEARPSGRALSSRDDPERLNLAMGELLQRLHAGRKLRTVYIGTPNY